MYIEWNENSMAVGLLDSPFFLAEICDAHGAGCQAQAVGQAVRAPLASPEFSERTTGVAKSGVS